MTSLRCLLTLSHAFIALLSQKIRLASTKANLAFIDNCVLVFMHLCVSVCVRMIVCVCFSIENWTDWDFWASGNIRSSLH